MLGILDNEQIEMLHRVLEHTMWNIEVPATENLRDLAIIDMLASTGMRVGN